MSVEPTRSTALVLWTDTNHDGRSQPDEMRSAASVGLVHIFTGYELVSEPEPHGNLFRLRAGCLLIASDDVPVACDVKAVRFMRE